MQRGIVIEFNGQMMTLKEISAVTGLSVAGVYHRYRNGIPIDASHEEVLMIRRGYTGKKSKQTNDCPKERISPECLRAYMQNGNGQEQAAKAIFAHFKFTNPADFNFRTTGDGRYMFDTEHFLFEITFDRLTATCCGRFKKNDAPLISRRYVTTDKGRIREVHV